MGVLNRRTQAIFWKEVNLSWPGPCTDARWNYILEDHISFPDDRFAEGHLFIGGQETIDLYRIPPESWSDI